ncbi:MAG TPA: hypothetical protein VMD77_16545 [Candidatus Baltobacteraceae bacterium]|nr:hypothetical protein [Candidatus Baltobacteraceae bacterium]
MNVMRSSNRAECVPALVGFACGPAVGQAPRDLQRVAAKISPQGIAKFN